MMKRSARYARLRGALLLAASAVATFSRVVSADLIRVSGSSRDEESVTRPVGALFDGRAFIAYAGTDGDNSLNVLRSDDLVAFNKLVFNNESVESSGGVAIAAFGDRLYLVFTATDQHLVLLSSPDGVTWNEKRVLADLSEHQPGLAVHDGRLVISYRNLGGGLNILSTPSPLDPGSYSLRANVGGSTDLGTAVASFDGRLLNAYTGQDDALNLQDLVGFGSTLRANYVSGDTSADGWWVTSWNGALHGAWRGSGNKALNVGQFSPAELSAALSNGDRVPHKVVLNQTSDLGPSLAGFGRVLALLWKGEDDHVNILQQATASPPPHICAFWPVAFVDSGYGESGLRGIGPQHAPARFTKYAVKDGTRIVQEGFLDAAGCIAVNEIPSTASTWTMELTTVLQRGDGLVDVRAIDAAFKGPTIDDQLKRPNSRNMILRANLRVGLDPEVSAVPSLGGDAVAEDLARIAAVAGQLLSTTIPLHGTAYAVNDGCKAYYPDSCASGNTLFMGPPANYPGALPQSQEKFVVAHEMGHVFEFLGGAAAVNDGYPPLGVTEPLCECDHVTVANKYHCLQSLEKPAASRIEGFAQFTASRAFNAVTDATPTFNYYKEFLWPQCPQGVDCEPFGSNFRQKPPIPVSASRPALWRNRHCPGVREFATEFDWMNFFWNVSLPGPLEVTFEQLYKISAEAVRTTTFPSNDAYLASAREVVSVDVAQRILEFGDQYGVSSNTSQR